MNCVYRRGICGLAGLLTLASANPARAQNVGDGGSYEQFILGLIESWTEPSSLVLLLSIGAMIGLWPSGGISRMLPFMAAGTLLGLLLSTLLQTPVDPELIILLLLLAGTGTSVLAVAALPLKLWLIGAITLLATGLGAVFLFMNYSAEDVPLATFVGSLTGMLLSIVLINNIIVMICERWTQVWVVIGFRVASSWLCAIAILLLAFALRT